jgi:hypothetical protein
MSGATAAGATGATGGPAAVDRPAADSVAPRSSRAFH